MKFVSLFSHVALLAVSAGFFDMVSASATTVEHDDLVRSQCRNIFETAFPPNRWTKMEDIAAFTQLTSTKPGNYLACPVGNEEHTLTNYEPKDVMNYLERLGFIPSDAFRYTKNILGPISVAGTTCSFEHDSFVLLGESCHVQSRGFLAMELDDEGKLYRWADHWDFNSFDSDMADCMAQLETAKSSVDEE